MLIWRPYIIPGLVFQSVVIGGGYATGRELVEFFMPSGPVGGVLGILVAGFSFALIMGTAYEFARLSGARDYRSFCKALLGRFWIVYELAYIALVLLILAVVGAAAGELLLDLFGWPTPLGTIAMMALVAAITFFGSSTIATLMAAWSLLLYLTYILLFAETFATYRDTIDHALSTAQLRTDWLLPGVRYASYNIALPAVLFCMVLITTRRQAIGAGIMTGIIAVVPALLFYVAMLSQYPHIRDEPVPALYLIAQLDAPALGLLFQLVVFGTFVETGAGTLHAINERIAVQVAENGKQLPRWLRPAIAGSLLVLAVYGATAIGIIDLVAQGYGLLSWVFILVLVIPLLTLGMWRILHTPP